jgi:2,3-bisphosphoglycerate-independent phosphoglycerate mutase
VLRGVVQALRAKTSGPEVVTMAYIDAESRFRADPKLVLGVEPSSRGGLLHRRLAQAGLRQLRISESGKAGHVTYFCDGGDVPEDAYNRVHPTSLTEDHAASPCLSSEASVATARAAVARGDVDFILMNLPNADILGHTSGVDATVAGIGCAERLLETFVREATARGFAVFITSDHGNAEDMVTDGELNRNHTTNPVPFIAIAPRGHEPFALRRRELPECLGVVAWTVLDALGLQKSPADSLLAP